MKKLILTLGLTLFISVIYGQNRFCIDCNLQEFYIYLDEMSIDKDSVYLDMPDSTQGRIVYYLENEEVSIWHFFNGGRIYLTAYIPATIETSNYFYDYATRELRATVDPSNHDILYTPDLLLIERKRDMFVVPHFMISKKLD